MKNPLYAAIFAALCAASLTMGAGEASAAGPIPSIGRPADAGGSLVQEVRWRGRRVGLGLALGLGLGLALAPRYSYANSYYYSAPPRRHCWYSRRYGEWVCRRHW